ncbi:hypothetical protein QFC19_006661 [Naganishia cerealis]|uniref:Uncharacterized protein n=1 Tax=Naganishia cerealis TaxID=610337 RepID=A0ACC2VEM7_9TREE|nr:hypothetical protein QFC19_006661 [Naganishia cerealis]
MSSIKEMLPLEVEILRNGERTSVDPKNLVLGDLVYVKLGNKVAADLRLVSISADLKFNKSILTGESKEIPGTVEATSENFLESHNIALQGSLCVGGSGLGIVVQAGDSTVFGRIAKLSTGDAPGLTTLQKEILRFVLIIASCALSIAVIVIILWGTWLDKKHKGFITVPVLIIDVVSVMVAFIPEGLPASVTISLSVIANALAKNKVLCKSLMTVETLGSCTMVLSDKTGNENLKHSGILTDEEGRQLQHIAAIAGLCNAAVFERGAESAPNGLPSIRGDATDTAILRFADPIKPVNESSSEWQEIFRIDFNSKMKFSKCHFALDPTSDQVVPLDDALKSRLNAKQRYLASQGQRVILLTQKIVNRLNMPKNVDYESADFAEFVNVQCQEGLIIVGLLGLVDPPKEDVSETIRMLRGAYIRCFMVTGDFASTAVAIAEQCSIITDATRVSTIEALDRDTEPSAVAKYDPDNLNASMVSLVLTGDDVMKMSESQWEQACQYQEVVFARTTPEQKLRIVKEMQSRGNIVAATGDGANDAAALKQADIGIAVAGGSDIAIEAADLILLESFSSMVVGVEYGRLV